MELTAIKDAFGRVFKKQRLYSSKTQEVIDQVCREIEHASSRMQSALDAGSPVDQISILTELKTKLNEIRRLSQLEGPQKELNVALSKYAKLLEKSFNPDISKAYRNCRFDTNTVIEIVAGHFYREGLFDIGDCLINEAKQPEASATLKSSFTEMHQILEAIRLKNLEPALNWASIHHDRLLENISILELKLRQLQFVEILHSSDLENSPFAEILSAIHWDTLTVEFTRQFCSIIGQSYKSPLSVVITAGVEVLPRLLLEEAELQAPLELGREFQFHSIFVCPNRKNVATKENPPMMTTCRHVFCKETINELLLYPLPWSPPYLKCPICPLYHTEYHCKQIYF